MTKTLRPGDSHFTIVDKFTVTARAGFEISNNCPAEYKSIFVTAINAGWLKPIAHVTDEEYMVMKLST
jgi:UDP-3-O-[3-hydroxymyristoyl] glucosamine N-acyltransferase